MEGQRLKKRFGPRGFTMVEMLISLSIFGIITAFAISNFRVGQQGDELRLSARTVASLIGRARTQAIAGYEVKYCHGGNRAGEICADGDDYNCGDGVCRAEIPPAYGINISAVVGENREVRIFADTNSNGRYDQGEAMRFDSVSPGPFVYVSAVSPAAANSVDIVFTPPKPTIKFNGAVADGLATIELTHSSTEDTTSVTVNRISGLISVE
ncbi:MAG: prepilin-type N-terminal cleavage/methylation domain-containing protein [Patescibacteria group bacterium]